MKKSYHSGSSDITVPDSTESLDYKLTNNQTKDEYEKEGELNFSFEHTFKNNEDHNLSFEATYTAYDEQEDKFFSQIYSFPNNNTDTGKYLIQKGGNQTEFLLDYALPRGEDGEFESGYAGEFIYNNIRYTNNSVLNRFLFNQQVHATISVT